MPKTEKPFATAYEGLTYKLRELNDHTSARDDEKAALPEDVRIAARNKWLTDYRDEALGVELDELEKRPEPKDYVTRVFSYVHGEFGFNTPRPVVSRTARITHLVFAPLFIEKQLLDTGSAEELDADPVQVMDKVTHATLEWMWRRAIHNFDPDAKSQNGAKPLSFRGAQDRYFLETDELFDFSEPYITPKRSILARKRLLEAKSKTCEADSQDRARFGDASKNQAVEKNRAIEARNDAAGDSHKLANVVEYYWKYYEALQPGSDEPAAEIAHVRWVRHDRPYQTFTFTHETPDFSGTSFGSEGEDPFVTTALHAFPGDFFEKGILPLKSGKEGGFAGVFGRFMQGANWMVVPAEKFFDVEVKSTKAEDKQVRFLEALQELTEGHKTLGERVKDRILKVLGRGNHATTPGAVRAIFDHANLDPLMAAGLDQIVIDAVQPFLKKCFHDDPVRSEREFIGIKCMNSRAYIFASMHHEAEGPQCVFTRALIVDCGMNKFQRGRLLETIAEFATERTMALRWIARFRLLHSALGVIEAKLNQAASNYHGSKNQFSPAPKTNGDPSLARDDVSVVPHAYWGGLHSNDYLNEDPSRDSAFRERQLIVTLEFLSSCLSLMNDVVEGGMMDRATGTLGSVASLRDKLKSIQETPIIGCQSLTDFLERRFIPATRVISRAGDRYQMLRTRITGIAELMNATLSAKEWRKNQRLISHQTALLTTAEIVGAVALAHYSSVFANELREAICEWQGPNGLLGWSPVFCGERMKVVIYVAALMIAVYFLHLAHGHFFPKTKPEEQGSDDGTPGGLPAP